MSDAQKNKPTLPLLTRKQGPPRIAESYKEATEKSGYLIDGVLYDDIDKEFIRVVKEEFKLVDKYDTEKEVPVHFFNSIDRWTEFENSWDNTDKNKNIELPFISIIRHPNPQFGTQRNGYWNIPGKRHYFYYKVPTFDGNREGVDIYKVPQPTPIDIKYEIKLFAKGIRLVNDFNLMYVNNYKSEIYYIKPKGLWMKTIIESIEDDSVLGEVDGRKYYVQPITINVCGYILDPKDFIIEKEITRVITDISIDLKPNTNFIVEPIKKNSGQFKQIIRFETGVQNTTYSFKAETNYFINAIELTNNTNKINSITIEGETIITDFTIGQITQIVVDRGDRIIINIEKQDIVDPSEIQLICEKQQD